MKHPDFLYKGKYNPDSSRLSGYNYSQNGLYFITICTHEREHIFGNIFDGKMSYSDIGGYTEKCILEIPHHFEFVQVGEYIVMPNHIHMILEFKKEKNVETQYFASNPVETQYFVSQNNPGNIFGPQSQNLASVIRGLKVGVTKFAREKTGIYQVWQTRFHDRIIRDEGEFFKIQEYIKNNPKNWEQDSLFS